MASQDGFTLVEMVAVIIIVGVLVAVAVPRLTGNQAFDELKFMGQVEAALRFAQKSAIAQRRLVCVAFSGSGVSPATITLRIATAFNNADCTGTNGADLALPAPPDKDCSANQVCASSGVAFSPASGPVTYPVDFNFSPSGRPFTPSGQPSAAQTIQVTGVASAITVEAETGYVHSD